MYKWFKVDDLRWRVTNITMNCAVIINPIEFSTTEQLMRYLNNAFV
jgi:hypothetical protein